MEGVKRVQPRPINPVLQLIPEPRVESTDKKRKKRRKRKKKKKKNDDDASSKSEKEYQDKRENEYCEETKKYKYRRLPKGYEGFKPVYMKYKKDMHNRKMKRTAAKNQTQ